MVLRQILLPGRLYARFEFFVQFFWGEAKGGGSYRIVKTPWGFPFSDVCLECGSEKGYVVSFAGVWDKFTLKPFYRGPIPPIPKGRLREAIRWQARAPPADP